MTDESSRRCYRCLKASEDVRVRAYRRPCDDEHALCNRCHADGRQRCPVCVTVIPDDFTNVSSVFDPYHGVSYTLDAAAAMSGTHGVVARVLAVTDQDGTRQPPAPLVVKTQPFRVPRSRRNARDPADMLHRETQSLADEVDVMELLWRDSPTNVPRVVSAWHDDVRDVQHAVMTDGGASVSLGPTLPLAAAARAALGLVQTLREVHAAGIEHNDVSPSNVLVNNELTLTLTDFGRSLRAHESKPHVHAYRKFIDLARVVHVTLILAAEAETRSWLYTNHYRKWADYDRFFDLGKQRGWVAVTRRLTGVRAATLHPLYRAIEAVYVTLSETDVMSDVACTRLAERLTRHLGDLATQAA
jgi:hypothetical protein